MHDKVFNIDRLKQQRSGTLEEGLQSMLEMYWSTTRDNRYTMPVIHGITLHYTIRRKGSKNEQGQR